MNAAHYAEHLAHSAPCASRWDGYDRGDIGYADDAATTEVIGRVTRPDGKKVEIVKHDDGRALVVYEVIFDGRIAHTCDDRAEAVTVARWWVAGCPV